MQEVIPGKYSSMKFIKNKKTKERDGYDWKK